MLGVDRASFGRSLGRTLDRLPSSWFTRLQRAHAAGAERSGPRRRAVDAAVRVARYRSLPVEDFALTDYPDVRFHAADSLITRLLYWYGGDGYEGAETLWWRRACASASHVLELGANVGYYTVQGAVANPTCRYVAVEPHPDSAAIVRRNLELNGIENVELVEAAAVGDAAVDRVELAIPDQDLYTTPAGAFIRSDGEGVGHISAERTVTVKTVAIADLIRGVDLLKLDIEGHEAEVLEPIFDVLCDTKPTIFLEVRLAEVPRLRALITRLAANGYVIFAIGERSLHLLTREELEDAGRLPRYGSRDLVLVDARSVHDM